MDRAAALKPAMAAIVITKERLLHLARLVGFSTLFAALLMHFLEWSRMAAFGLSVTVVCQVNAAIMQQIDAKARADEKNEQRTLRAAEGSAKKRR